MQSWASWPTYHLLLNSSHIERPIETGTKLNSDGFSLIWDFIQTQIKPSPFSEVLLT